MKYLLVLICLLLACSANANDGAFFAAGNQLIPIKETDVRLNKEILNITRINERQVRIDVYYELMNPNKEKEVLVGFEAASPSGDVDGTPKNGQHPYMSGFSVSVNETRQPYKVAIVTDSVYYKDGQFRTIKPVIENENEVGFFYVYHFKALFRKGKNTIRHSYVFDLSGSVDQTMSLMYMLTTARRWSNGRIDDFTLNINMGPFSEFMLERSFFQHNTDWTFSANGRMMPGIKTNPYDEHTYYTQCYIQEGSMSFHQKDFIPAGELSFYAPRYVALNNSEALKDAASMPLPFSCAYDATLDVAQLRDGLAKKIFQNLPYARRGYVFRNPELKAIFEAQEWYVPDPAYVPEPKDLSANEQLLLQHLGQ